MALRTGCGHFRGTDILQISTRQERCFPVASGPSTQRLIEIPRWGSGGYIFNNSSGDFYAPWGWKPSFLEMVCIDFLPLEQDRNSDQGRDFENQVPG